MRRKITMALALIAPTLLLTGCSTDGSSPLGWGDPANVAMPPPSRTPEIYRPLVNKAIDANEEGRPDEARKLYNEIIAKDPTSAEADCCRGELSTIDKKNREAISYFDSALAKNPRLETVYNDRGNCYRALDMMDKAISDYSIAMLLGPGPVHWVCRAHAYIAKKEYVKAMQDATIAIKKDKNYASAYLVRAEAWEGLKNFKQAEIDYCDALNVPKVPAIAYYKRGAFYLEHDQPHKARLDFAAASKADPSDGDYFYWLGEADMQLQDFVSARADFLKYKTMSEQSQQADDVETATNWLRQVDTEEYDQANKPTQKKYQWALACSAQLFLQNDDGLWSLAGEEPTVQNIDSEKKALKDWWSITNRKQLLAMLDRQLRDGHDSLWREYHVIIKRGNPAEKLEKLAHNPLDLIELNDRMDLVREYGDKFGERGIMAWDLCRYISLCRWGYRVGWLSEDEAYAHILPVARRLQTSYSSWEQMGQEYLIGRRFWSASQYKEDKEDSEKNLHTLLTWKKSPWVILPWKTNLD